MNSITNKQKGRFFYILTTQETKTCKVLSNNVNAKFLSFNAGI